MLDSDLVAFLCFALFFFLLVFLSAAAVGLFLFTRYGFDQITRPSLVGRGER